MRFVLLLAALAAACSSLPTVGADAGAGACSVDAGRAVCDGGCVSLADDPAHCGACGRACADGATCREGRCTRRFTDLSSAADHTCAVEVGGAVWCWGSNESGQCGDGEKSLDRARPVRVQGLRATRVYAGYAHSCARAHDDALRCWGADARNELGDGAPAPVRLAPVAARGVTRPAAVALGMGHTCAADEDGAVLCWGTNEWGALGDGRSGRRQPVAPVGIDGVTGIGSGWGHVCALAAFGSVFCWGSRGFAQIGDGRPVGKTGVYVTPVQAVAEGITALVVGNTVACALDGDGAVWCWGDNPFGSSGDGTTERRWSPRRVPGLRATALWGGFATYFARRDDGALVGWGRNEANMLGIPGGESQLRPAPVLGALGPRVTRVVAGGSHACALLSDQSVRCWGGNARGQLGAGTSGDPRITPEEPAW